MSYPEIFLKIVKLISKKGHRNLNELPGCFEFEIDPDWKISFNPHKKRMTDLSGGEVYPHCIIIRYKTMPVGVIDPHGGSMMTGTEPVFIEALDKQLYSDNTTVEHGRGI